MRKHKRPIFVVQEHHASSSTTTSGLEHDGVLKSWAVPRDRPWTRPTSGWPCRSRTTRSSYATFEGTIPSGSYGAGEVSIWDHGTYEPAAGFTTGLEAGKVEFVLDGEKLKGRF